MRTIGPFVRSEEGEGYSLFWAVEGRGRRSVTCDLRTPAGQAVFRRLAAGADVVLRTSGRAPWRHGASVPTTSTLTWSTCGSACSARTGRTPRRPGLDRLGIAYGGLLHLTGEPDRPPVRPGVTISDYLTGVFAAMAAVAGLYQRDRPPGGVGGGRAAVIDAPLYGSILRVLEWTLAGYDQLGTVRTRQGNRLANSAPLDNYPTADGTYICIVGGSDANFARLCRAMGREDLIDDPRFDTLGHRSARADEINGIVAEWTGSRRASDIEAECIAHDVPVGRPTAPTRLPRPPHGRPWRSGDGG